MELATKAGLHLSAVTRFEQGVRQPSLATAGQLATALALPVDEFFKPCELDLPPSSRGRPAKPGQAIPSNSSNGAQEKPGRRKQPTGADVSGAAKAAKKK
jgi:transcriptional regulator with XRE-family HTH domain